MRGNVKLFAILRERAGTAELVIHLRPPATVADAVDTLADKFPDLAALLPRVAYAVNQNYVKREATLSEGDELALIPPVSGGADDECSKARGPTRHRRPER